MGEHLPINRRNADDLNLSYTSVANEITTSLSISQTLTTIQRATKTIHPNFDCCYAFVVIFGIFLFKFFSLNFYFKFNNLLFC